MNQFNVPPKSNSAHLEAPVIKISPVKVPNGAKHIGNYILGKTIGSGSFGKVHLGLHIQSGQKVAIKIIQKMKLTSKDLERIHRQIQILKMVIHPSIVQLYQIIETQKSLLLVTQYIPNGQLFNNIIENKKLKQKDACQIFQQIIGALQYMHQIGITHRDLKPENILLDFDKSIKIIDFGLSNIYSPGQKLKTECGSPCYAAPEMIQGKHKYVPMQIDIWSCGIILFAMVSGFLPFCDTDTSKLYKKIVSGSFKFPNGLSEQVKDLIENILIVNPHKRISLSKIKEHPWFHLIPYYPRFGIDSKLYKVPVETCIIDNLVKMNINKSKILENIQKNKKNKETSMYYLIAKKLTKEGHPLKAYICNPDFDHKLVRMLSEQDNNSTIVQITIPQIPLAQPITEVKPTTEIPIYSLKSTKFKPILQAFLNPEESDTKKAAEAKIIFYGYNTDNCKKRTKLLAKSDRQKAQTLFHIKNKQDNALTKLNKNLKTKASQNQKLELLQTINMPSDLRRPKNRKLSPIRKINQSQTKIKNQFLV